MARGYAMGWSPDLPDVRDYTPKQMAKEEWLPKGTRALHPPKAGIPDKVDLSKWCSPVEDQDEIGSCTAHAGVGLLEYYERRAHDEFIDASRLFLYKATRNLLKWTGDTGAYLRSTMKAMVLFGVPPESYWPYDVSKYDDEPSAFLYAFGQSYKAIRYYRLDEPSMSPGAVLKRVREFLAAGYPSMFGFTVYNFGNSEGEIAYPGTGDAVKGGHAVVAIGYDDNRKIGGKKGALMIRNSWGTEWGKNGYGWLPYAYVENGLADDFWSLFKADYVKTSKFD